VRRTPVSRRTGWLVGAAIAVVLLVGLGLWGRSREESIRRQLDEVLLRAGDDPERAEANAAALTDLWTTHSSAAWVVRAVCFLRLGQTPEAYGCWAQVKDARSVPTADLLALAEAAMGRDDRLDWMALEAADRPQADRRDWLVAALRAPPPAEGRYANQGNVWERELLGIAASEDGPAGMAIAEARLRRGEYATAAAAFGNSLVAKSPPLSETHWRAAAVRGFPLLVETGQFDLVRPVAERTRSLRPKPPVLSYALAVFDRAEGRLDAALVEVQEAQLGDPGNPRSACLLGLLLQETGQSDAAERVFRQAIDRFPRVPEPRHRLARLLRQTDRSAEADQQDAIAQTLAAEERNRLNKKGEAARAAPP
jgi:tetratricopeptide (TPR) repeat protein